MNKLCEIKVDRKDSLQELCYHLTANGYTVQTAVVWKEFPGTSIDYWMIAIFDKDSGIANDCSTANAMEVVHGQWLDTREYCGDFMCSNCNALCGTNKFNYCPNCGAKMDLEEKK